MSRNLSFDYVIKNVREREGIDLSTLLLRIENSHIVPQSPDEMSEEYKVLTARHREISMEHSASGAPLTAEEHHDVALWNQCHDRCQEIINEAESNIWYFFREILRVPHGLDTEGLIPTDMRDPDDYHFQMTEWGIKALWAYQNDLCCECTKFYSMQRDQLIAGIVTHKLFVAAKHWLKDPTDHRYTPINIVGEVLPYAYAISEPIAKLVWLMIGELKHFSFLGNIVEAIYEIVDTNSNSWGTDVPSPWMFNVDRCKLHMIGEYVASHDGFTVAIRKNIHEDMHATYIKRNGGFLGFCRASQINKNLPELTFEIIMNDLKGKMSRATHAMYRIDANISELLSKRIPVQKDIIQSFVHRYSAYVHNRNMKLDDVKDALKSLQGIYELEMGVVLSTEVPDKDTDWMSEGINTLQLLQKKASE